MVVKLFDIHTLSHLHSSDPSRLISISPYRVDWRAGGGWRVSLSHSSSGLDTLQLGPGPHPVNIPAPRQAAPD